MVYLVAKKRRTDRRLKVYSVAKTDAHLLDGVHKTKAAATNARLDLFWLVSEVGKRLVGFSHTMRVFTLLDCVAFVA
jgi:hypothetical protein